MDGTLKKKYETTTVLYWVVDGLNKCWVAGLKVKNINHEGHEGTRRKSCPAWISFVILRVLCVEGFFWHAGGIFVIYEEFR